MTTLSPGFAVPLRRQFAVAMLLWSAIMAACPAAADADPAALPPELTASEAIDLMRSHNPTLAARRAGVAVADSDVVAAGMLPNPTFSYTSVAALSGPNTIDGSQHTTMLEQPVLLAGQRGLRRRAAEQHLATAGADVRQFEAELVEETQRRFLHLLAAQEAVARFDQVRDRFAAVERIIAGRAGAGAMSRFDVARVDVELRSLDAERAAAEQERIVAAIDLATAIGIPGWQPRARGMLAPSDLVADVDQWWPAVEAELPAIVASRSAAEGARREVELARRERLPVPSIAAGPFITTSPESWNAVIGVSVPLPLFDRGRAGVMRAVAEANATGLQQQATLETARLRLERAAQAVRRRRTTLMNFEADVMAQLPGLRRMAEDAYRSGRGSVLDLLDVFRSDSELQEQHLELTVAVLEAEIEFLAAVGRSADFGSAHPPAAAVAAPAATPNDTKERP